MGALCVGGEQIEPDLQLLEYGRYRIGGEGGLCCAGPGCMRSCCGGGLRLGRFACRSGLFDAPGAFFQFFKNGPGGDALGAVEVKPANEVSDILGPGGDLAGQDGRGLTGEGWDLCVVWPDLRGVHGVVFEPPVFGRPAALLPVGVHLPELGRSFGDMREVSLEELFFVVRDDLAEFFRDRHHRAVPFGADRPVVADPLGDLLWSERFSRLADTDHVVCLAGDGGEMPCGYHEGLAEDSFLQPLFLFVGEGVSLLYLTGRDFEALIDLPWGDSDDLDGGLFEELVGLVLPAVVPVEILDGVDQVNLLVFPFAELAKLLEELHQFWEGLAPGLCFFLGGVPSGGYNGAVDKKSPSENANKVFGGCTDGHTGPFRKAAASSNLLQHMLLD